MSVYRMNTSGMHFGQQEPFWCQNQCLSLVQTNTRECIRYQVYKRDLVVSTLSSRILASHLRVGLNAPNVLGILPHHNNLF
jgi:hypothetical protein